MFANYWQVGLLKPEHLDKLGHVETLYNSRLGVSYIKARTFFT